MNIHIPARANGKGSFEKLGLRKGTSCSVTSVAVWLENAGPEIRTIRIGVGGAAPVPLRAIKAEKEFSGKKPQNRKEVADLSEAIMEDVSQITDVRGTADYRREVTVKLLTKAVAHCLGMEE
jgi:carbon-monoxide dehydrogenase medium subunit